MIATRLAGRLGNPDVLCHADGLAAQRRVDFGPRGARRSAACAEPAQAASADRSVLRRCANAASTTANTSSRLTRPATSSRLGRSGPSRRGHLANATSAESTFGTGQNTVLETVPARRAVPYQASLTDGTP